MSGGKKNNRTYFKNKLADDLVQRWYKKFGVVTDMQIQKIEGIVHVNVEQCLPKQLNGDALDLETWNSCIAHKYGTTATRIGSYAPSDILFAVCCKELGR